MKKLADEIKKPANIILIIALILLVLAFVAINPPAPHDTEIVPATPVGGPDDPDGGTDETIQLPASEIRDYEGEQLSSIDDFRENSIKGPQYVDVDTYRLEVTGLVDSPLSLTYDEVLAYDAYQKVVTLYCVEGWDVKLLWEGILVSDLLADAGVQAGANTVIFHAYDGYTTSFPLEYLTDNPILLAYKLNEIQIPPERGFPFQLVAESKWGYKWIKWVTKIELSDDESYEGFWESRGYSNTADLDEGFFS